MTVAVWWIGCGWIGMVGLIEAGAFEDDTGWEKHSADLPATLMTNCQRFIGHFLPGLKSVATAPAEIFIRWHTTVTPKLSHYATWAYRKDDYYIWSLLLYSVQFHCCQSFARSANNEPVSLTITWQEQESIPEKQKGSSPQGARHAPPNRRQVNIRCKPSTPPQGGRKGTPLLYTNAPGKPSDRV